ncbi:MAG: hypothetical protein J5I98_05805, partial [Phaeodactylibacter sp.]|nr:hypothetical protein [Phaeodactylibacter sp.]
SAAAAADGAALAAATSAAEARGAAGRRRGRYIENHKSNIADQTSQISDVRRLIFDVAIMPPSYVLRRQPGELTPAFSGRSTLKLRPSDDVVLSAVNNGAVI